MYALTWYPIHRVELYAYDVHSECQNKYSNDTFTFPVSPSTDQFPHRSAQEEIRCSADRLGKEKDARRTRGGGSITAFTRKGVKIEKIVGGAVTSDVES